MCRASNAFHAKSAKGESRKDPKGKSMVDSRWSIAVRAIDDLMVDG